MVVKRLSGHLLHLRMLKAEGDVRLCAFGSAGNGMPMRVSAGW